MKKTLKRLYAVMLAVLFAVTMLPPISVSAQNQSTTSNEAQVGVFAEYDVSVESLSAVDSATVSIIFHVNGGSGINRTFTMTPGQRFGTLPPAPTRVGHRFLGWYTTAGTGGQHLTPDSTVPPQGRTYWARWAAYTSRILTHTGSMMITGWASPAILNSTPISFNGNTIPLHSEITSISIHTGQSTMSGVIIPNDLRIRSSASNRELVIPWQGAITTLNNTPFFWGEQARATYTVWWTGRITGNTMGNIFNPGGFEAVRGFSNLRLTINFITIPPSSPVL